MAEIASRDVPADGLGRPGRLVDVGDAQLYVVEAGQATGYPIVVLHGGPGLDHHEFADYLDPLTERGYRLILADQRSSGRSPACDPATWTLENNAADVGRLARSMGLGRFAVLGHSYGAFVTLQHAVDLPGEAAQSIVSGGVPSARFLAAVDANLDAFEPAELREQVKESWERETGIRTREDFASVMHDQLPFHFADPLDPRIEDYERRTAGTVYSPDVLRTFAANDYGSIEVEDRLGAITQPLLVTTGRHDRTCTPEAAEAIAAGAPTAELAIFERSGHMTFVEEQEEYLAVVEDFLGRHGGA
ncbi:MAG TPA: alpha/beta fold hydrolase [Actinomycetota bacterium]|nr:alpha/beta fold hydrolase [Actinomycetota bacterium]